MSTCLFQFSYWVKSNLVKWVEYTRIIAITVTSGAAGHVTENDCSMDRLCVNLTFVLVHDAPAQDVSLLQTWRDYKSLEYLRWTFLPIYFHICNKYFRYQVTFSILNAAMLPDFEYWGCHTNIDTLLNLLVKCLACTELQKYRSISHATPSVSHAEN